MDVYAESVLENTEYFFPDEKDKRVAVQKAETGFLEYLRTGFFTLPGSQYWICEIGGVYVSALRTYRLEPGLYYMEALETHPKYRRTGYGSGLLAGVEDALRKNGPFRLCSCVSKKNTDSLKTHEKSGFRIVSDVGFDYLSGEADSRDYGMEYSFHGE